MPQDRQPTARDEFRRTLRWIVVVAILMVAGALAFVGSQTELKLHVIVATVLGVFFSVLLGTGLFALAFFSSKSGHDDAVTDSTRRADDNPR